MAGRGIRLYTDEDVNIAVAGQLNRLGYEVLTCVEAGNANLSLSDDWQLGYATAHQRTILVHNIDDYIAEDQKWRAEGREHYGIVFAAWETPLSELIRRTRLHLDRFSVEDHYNVCLWVAL